MPPVALITGTSKGLGYALALRLLAEGWTVHGFSRQSSAIEHSQFTGHLVDITDESAVRIAVENVAQSAARIDLLINNAGAASMNALLLTPGSVAEKLMRVNYLGTFHCLQSVGKVMVRQRGGLIINLTTVAVPLSLEGEASYIASKAAVEALTRVAATELAAVGIKVLALGFGPIDTDLTRAVPSAALAKINARIGRPQGTAIGEAVDFVISAIQDKAIPSGSVRYLGEV
jgi:3-oxoacyl-[acyl-carrier protein] reductase